VENLFCSCSSDDLVAVFHAAGCSGNALYSVDVLLLRSQACIMVVEILQLNDKYCGWHIADIKVCYSTISKYLLCIILILGRKVK
jgi:hypothetical protein